MKKEICSHPRSSLENLFLSNDQFRASQSHIGMFAWINRGVLLPGGEAAQETEATYELQMH